MDPGSGAGVTVIFGPGVSWPGAKLTSGGATALSAG